MERTAPLHLPTTTTNPEGNMEDKVNRREHTRQLLYEVLKERGVKSNSVTGEKIDEKSDIDALLQVIQIEKEKNKEQGKISQVKSASSKPADMSPQKCDLISGLWGLAYEFNKFWFSYLVLKPFTTWLEFLMYDC
ncbi:MAG TPA: hypothetical protein VKA95_02335 [Nitrososphaeraceae archaeon]|nr:hypothetical protein [Nitrososphaeraceae archaeon]